MDLQLRQRDLGRVESKLEDAREDIKELRTEIGEIKSILTGQTAVSTWNWKVLSGVAVLASLATHVINWVKPILFNS